MRVGSAAEGLPPPHHPAFKNWISAKRIHEAELLPLEASLAAELGDPKPWLTANIHPPGTGLALALLALTQVPIATEAILRVYCIIEMHSYKEYDIPRATRFCNGG